MAKGSAIGVRERIIGKFIPRNGSSRDILRLNDES
jgi:hypothetical protein